VDAFQKKAIIKLVDAIPPIDAGYRAAPLRLPLPIWRDVPRRAAEDLARFWRLIVFVFLPFAAGFYLSYLFRTINALISSELTSDLALGAADLGLLTSVYFLTFGAAQIPIGVMLDRYGPRRVQSALLLIAAAGAALFSISEGFSALVLARALIGLGVAAALIAGLKAIVLWFPKERVATANGYMVMFGALGAVTATAPAELLLARIGWRGLFELLAIATAATAAVIYLLVPEPRSAASASNRSADIGLRTIYTDTRFWRLAPLSATCVGSAWALQGLWAAPWLTDVEGIDRPGLIRHLFVMAVALGAGAVLLGTAADRSARRGIGPEALMAIVAAIFIAIQLALILQLPVPSYLSWSVVAAVGAGTVLSYAIVAEYFPQELAGRANGALNVFHLGGAFIVQYSIGLILQQWTRDDGHYPATAYQIAFGVNVAFQILALTWFELPRIRRSLLSFSSTSLRVLCGGALQSRMYCRRAARIWARRVDSVLAQARNWRLATLRSARVSALFGLTLAISASRASVTPYVIKVARQQRMRVADPTAAGHAPPDAQIAYFLGRFVNNVRSLSTDPMVIRANWIDALSYVTHRGARMLDDDVCETRPFTPIGLRSVAVKVIYVIRASRNSFELRWQEETHESGAIIKTEHFTGAAEIIFKEPTQMLNNPLGLYVRAFHWSRDLMGESK
jgi:type IV secretory pathway TrbF-like protein/sugar phosphate permease